MLDQLRGQKAMRGLAISDSRRTNEQACHRGESRSIVASHLGAERDRRPNGATVRIDALSDTKRVPTLFDWTGGMPAIERLFEVFYSKVALPSHEA